MAALYEEFTQVESDHPFRALMMEVTTDVIPGVIAWKATLLAIGQSGLWPSFYSDMKEADDQVRALVKEIENFFSHPIDTIAKFAEGKWEGVKKDWEKYKSLVASGEPRKMFEAGVMAGKVLGNLILTILAIVSLYGLAVRAAQVVAMGARVVFGLVTLEVAEANVVAAETALAAARTAAAEASGAIESAQAARSITAAEKALEAARLQRSLAQAGEKLPTLTRRVMSEIKEAPKTSGEAGKGGGAVEEGAKPQSTSPGELERGSVESGKFKDPELESSYQKYRARKAKRGEPPRSRSDWLKAHDYWLNESPMARGNRFNERASSLYDYNEVNLENGKRLDSYDPDNGGKIISRKATDFDRIQPSTFEDYLAELKEKYAPGTKIRSNKYPDIDGSTLTGQQVLEVPESNIGSGNQPLFEKMASDQGVSIRYTPEQ